jgi:ribonuclease III
VAAAIEVLCERLGVQPTDPSLLELALVHASWAAEHDAASNQRLEFLGDAVLGLVVAETIFLAHPELDEGGLSKARIALVNETTLAEIASEIGLGDLLVLGRGAEGEGLRTKPSVLSDALEALIGATYLSDGIEAARALVRSLLGDRIEAAADEPGARDFKSLLHEWAQATSRTLSYSVTESGPPHERRYEAQVMLDGTTIASGGGRTKKSAEMDAAKAAWGEIADA